MDHISISQLKLEMIIGTLNWERAVKQPIYLDISFNVDARSIAKNDSIEHTVSYAEVQTCLEVWAAQNQPQLIETAAELITTHLIETFSFKWVKLVLHKKQALSNTQGISICIERTNV